MMDALGLLVHLNQLHQSYYFHLLFFVLLMYADILLGVGGGRGAPWPQAESAAHICLVELRLPGRACNVSSSSQEQQERLR